LSANPPWIKALRAERFLPSGVLGPVECWAFSRLDWVRLGIDGERGGVGEGETEDGESALTVLLMDDEDMASLLLLGGRVLVVDRRLSPRQVVIG
jgi:hypothetical protein